MKDYSSFKNEGTIFKCSEDLFYKKYYTYVDSTKNSELLTILFDPYGHESISNIFAVWEQKGEKVILKGILNRSVRSSLTYLCIENFFKISENDYIMILESGGSSRIGWWHRPFNLEIIHEEGLMFSDMGPLETEDKLEYKVNKDTITIEITRKERNRIADQGYSEWMIAEKKIWCPIKSDYAVT